MSRPKLSCYKIINYNFNSPAVRNQPCASDALPTELTGRSGRRELKAGLPVEMPVDMLHQGFHVA